jgi:hypothetical protein
MTASILILILLVASALVWGVLAAGADYDDEMELW